MRLSTGHHRTSESAARRMDAAARLTTMTKMITPSIAGPGRTRAT